MKIIIIGGVAGGATAAARLRRLAEKDEIIIMERDEFISYANCGLPYYIGNVIKDKEKLQVQTVEGLSKRYNLDIRNKTEVLLIDKAKKIVKVKNLRNNDQYDESYDKLILSCGAKPIKPHIKGLEEADNVFILRNIPDTYKIKEYTTNNEIKKAVVVGGGFIGVEMAENLQGLGIEVTLVEKMPQVLRQYDFEMAQIIHNEINNHGVKLILGDGVSSFEQKGKVINLESGTKIDTDMVILAIGVTPENTLAKGANLKLGTKGHVITSDTFNTFDATTNKTEEDVFAIGDMIEVVNTLDDSNYAVPLAWGANRQGRLLADHINGLQIKPSKIMGTSVLKVFDLTVASTGSNEAVLKSKNIDYTVVHAHRGNHASYYPNSSNIALKILFDKESGRIYGAQAIGRDGTEKRIDVLSTVMRLNGTVFDLSDLELSYAPPYSSAKDPVNVLGYIAENIISGLYKMAYHYDIDKIVSDGGYLLDVRSEFEFGNGHIEGAKNIDIDILRKNLDKITVSKETPIYVYCQIGLKAYMAIQILKNAGFTNLYNLSGGYITYKYYKYQLNTMAIAKVIEVNDNQKDTGKIIELDVCGLQCPGPLMATYKSLESMNIGEKVTIVATDSGFSMDIDNWCKANGHTVVSKRIEDGRYYATVQKGNATCGGVVESNQKNATMVVFSGELDKVLASMIIAQGAAAQGKDVTMFFTFWGLNALRRSNRVKTKKNFIERMFGKMMPRGVDKLPLSNMNMGGMGSKMIKGRMKLKKVDDLATMIRKAQEVGVKMIACTMSMDLMGIKKEELIDGIEYAGVATYISRNENVGTTLFI
jgi:NADPH-dependent 2,4-dienoyl-CoA reductase/sulfur reductase-like enzyme/peroxiredoxin family protein/TusA-related sulfurtransferase/rhodanese-related sulfurtransferase